MIVMSFDIVHRGLARAVATGEYALVMLVCWTATGLARAESRWQQLRFDDEGSETTEKAVLTAIGLAVALGLGAAITAVVNKYQGQIR